MDFFPINLPNLLQEEIGEIKLVLFSFSNLCFWEKHWPRSTNSEIAAVLLQQLSGLRLKRRMTMAISHFLA